jgi:DNA-binding Xre family transcriptional regulator
MNAPGKVRTNGHKKKISFKKIKDSIHVPEAQLRAALKSKSLREEQIEFLCELLSIESNRQVKPEEITDFDDFFMQGKIFC